MSSVGRKFCELQMDEVELDQYHKLKEIINEFTIKYQRRESLLRIISILESSKYNDDHKKEDIENIKIINSLGVKSINNLISKINTNITFFINRGFVDSRLEKFPIIEE